SRGPRPGAALRACDLGCGHLGRVLARVSARSAVIDLLVLAAILAACTAAGLLLLRVAGALPDARDEHLLARLIARLGLASILALALAPSRALHRWPLVIARAIALVAGWAELLDA